MGVSFAGKVAKGYHTGMQGRFRVEHNGKTARRLCSVESRPKRQNETNRLSTASRQGLAAGSSYGHTL